MDAAALRGESAGKEEQRCQGYGNKKSVRAGVLTSPMRRVESPVGFKKAGRPALVTLVAPTPTSPRRAPMNLLINPEVRYAVHPADLGRIEYIDGMAHAWPKTLPKEGERLTVQFLVHPQTREPLPVRIAAIQTLWQHDHHVVAVVVTLDQ